jgi:hypothetical protein
MLHSFSYKIFHEFHVTKVTDIVIIYLVCEGMWIVSDPSLVNDVRHFSILLNYLIFTPPPIQWAPGLSRG